MFRGLAAAGDSVHALMARRRQAPPETLVHRLPVTRGLRWWALALPLWARAIGQCWRTCGFDLLRAHSARFTGPACLLARRRWRLPVPLVTHLHHLDPSPFNRLVERPVLRGSDLVIVDSAAARDQVVALGVPVSRLRVVRPGVAERYYQTRLGVGGRDPGLLVAMGPLIARKDPGFALRALAAVLRAGPADPLRLVWVGDGPLRARLLADARRLGIADFLLLPGCVDEATKVALLRRAGLFLHTASLEGFALAPQEAMASGVPVLLRRAAWAEGLEGAVRWVESPEDLAEGIRTLLADRGLRHRLGQAGRAYAERHCRWQSTVDGARAVYEEAFEVEITCPPECGEPC